MTISTDPLKILQDMADGTDGAGYVWAPNSSCSITQYMRNRGLQITDDELAILERKGLIRTGADPHGREFLVLTTTSKTKTVQLGLRMRPEHLEQLREQAAKDGIPAASWAIAAIVRELRKAAISQKQPTPLLVDGEWVEATAHGPASTALPADAVARKPDPDR